MTRRRAPWVDALAIGAATAAAGWLASRWSGLLGAALLLCGAVAGVAWTSPRLGVAALDHLLHALRAFHWRREQGRHHAFAGVPLQVVDDGRQVWIGGDGLQRVLGTRDTDEVLAARHAGRWRRDADGRLMLRVDAVVAHLAQAPGRLDPRTARLRRYLERDVLYPAARRREQRVGR